MPAQPNVRDYNRDELIIIYYEDMKKTHKQIAEMFNISKARVGQLYRRIVKERKKKQETRSKRNMKL